MDCPIKLPVKVDQDGVITDAMGRVVANFCWLNEYGHVLTQVEKAKFVAWLLNEFGRDRSVPKPSDPPFGVQPEARRGNPLFRKGSPNPYAKKLNDNQNPAA